jgi:putative hemolysin
MIDRTFARLAIVVTLLAAPALAQVAPTLANPASTHCVASGGRLSMEQNPRGGTFGVCVFDDNRQCEEWALLRGHCPVGGLRVTGYVTPAARYCAITGGRYTITSGSGTAGEQGTCLTARGSTCDAKAWFDGTCAR